MRTDCGPRARKMPLPPPLGRGDTWQIHGDLPAGREWPYNDRKLIMKPAAKQKSMEVLQDAGIAACVIKGDKYKDLEYKGQDNISISLIAGGWEVYCVADGHGGVGHMVATHCTRSLPYHLESDACQTKLQNGDPRGALEMAFHLTHEGLIEEAKKENVFDQLSVSGATFACLLKDPEHRSVWVAHLGDSRTILFSPDDVLMQTQDHNAKVPAELQRIQDCGCEVRTRSYDDGFESSRIYVRDQEFPGIMMTRCFGDLCVKAHGITCDPEIAHWKRGADANECYILMASDGVWEFMDTWIVHAMVSNQLREGKTLQDVCSHLIREAKKRWAAAEPDYCDDISVIILPLTGKPLPHVEPCPEATGCFSACEKCVVL